MGRDVRAGPPLIQSDLSVPGVSSRSGNTFVGFCTGECLDAKDAALGGGQQSGNESRLTR